MTTAPALAKSPFRLCTVSAFWVLSIPTPSQWKPRRDPWFPPVIGCGGPPEQIPHNLPSQGSNPNGEDVSSSSTRSSPRLRWLCSIKSPDRDACGLGQVFRRTRAGNLFSYAPDWPVDSRSIFTPGGIVELVELFFRYVPLAPA